MEPLIVVKYGEIALKGRNRPVFERRLMENIARATGLSIREMTWDRGRIYLNVLQEQFEGALSHLPFVFGIHAYVPAYRTERELERIEEACLQAVGEEGGIRTFAIDTRRAARDFPLNSVQLNAWLGERVLSAFPGLKVRLKGPDLTVTVEIRPDRALIYASTQERAGAGGMPVGTAGKGLLLLSGGIDSPVAGWLMLKRGMQVDAIYFHSFPFTGEKSKEKVLDLARVLSRWKARPVRVFVPAFTEAQKVIAHQAPEAYWTILFRRAMNRIAEVVAKREGYQALLTGESLGQVASQTLENIEAIGQATGMLTLRPLLGYDKLETIALARRIGTYDLSIQPYEDCCTVFLPRQPKTKADPQQVAAIEAGLDLDGALQEAVASMQVYQVGEDTIESVPWRPGGRLNR
ncbi:MAG: tRNA 4-thiouridine(8) synthase ThiI [Candidatus Tectomicrobia bacterium]|uniref:Probable tRNA sulfurtransferase n=1 Tax=Tectimicrobiota bacterium TaxID=2528274 RepID=A0A932CQ59_UNCTE|nr:tRNA 4-thiouridine(8) synthase ThiI [Candidatus Tectomicrobia bacterium]